MDSDRMVRAFYKSFDARHRDGENCVHDQFHPQTIDCSRQKYLAPSLIALATVFATSARAEPIRLATFNTELSRDGPGLLLRDILGAKDRQVNSVIDVLNFAKADVLVLQNFDWDLELRAIKALNSQLEDPYPFIFSKRPNTGIQSGKDLNLNGKFGEPGDAFGYGEFAGQDGMALLSRFPILNANVIDFTTFDWRDLPGAKLDLSDEFSTESAAEIGWLRLSSTAHWVVPISIGSRTLTILTHHATPPVFDGPEDRNGRRNADELLFWVEFLEGELGVPPIKENLVMLSVTNLDPNDGDGLKETYKQFLDATNFVDPKPHSTGGQSEGQHDAHLGDPSLDTVDWPEDYGPGNLRVDYALPSADLTVMQTGVVWPKDDSYGLGRAVRHASRHRLVYLDIDF